MGWILLFGPIVAGILITLLQIAIYRVLLLARIIKQEHMPMPPIIIMRSFLILIVLFAILYFTGYVNGFIEPLDPTKPPEGTKMHEEMQKQKKALQDGQTPNQVPTVSPKQAPDNIQPQSGPGPDKP